MCSMIQLTAACSMKTLFYVHATLIIYLSLFLNICVIFEKVFRLKGQNYKILLVSHGVYYNLIFLM